MQIMSRRRRRLWAAVGISAAWATVAAFSGPTATAVALPASQPVAVVALSTPARAPQGKVVIRPLTILRAPGQVGVVIAHRGDSLATPENTMPAFLSSISRGANYLELDVRLSKDGVPVVIHDRTVDRTTDGTGAVSQLTAAQLRALDAGSWFSDSYASTRIPTLAEVLDLVSGTRVSAVIEYKGDWNVAAIRTTVDMIDEDDRIVVRADLPGLDEKDIEVTVHDGMLTVRGERKAEKEEKKEGYYYNERSYGMFSRTLPLPAAVEADKVKATFKKGVLEVHLPKAKEAQGKKIEIKAA